MRGLFEKICRFLGVQLLLSRFGKVARDPQVREDEDLSPLLDFSRNASAAYSVIDRKLSKDWTVLDFETAAELILSLEEAQEHKIGESSSTFKDANKLLRWMKASGSLDKIQAPAKKVRFLYDFKMSHAHHTTLLTHHSSCVYSSLTRRQP